jgi:hypothetical protein
MVLLTLLVIALLVAHQDFWFWDTPLLVGFVPIGLLYHAAFCVACAVLMWLLVRLAWPRHLETWEAQGVRRDEGGPH